MIGAFLTPILFTIIPYYSLSQNCIYTCFSYYLFSKNLLIFITNNAPFYELFQKKRSYQVLVKQVLLQLRLPFLLQLQLQHLFQPLLLILIVLLVRNVIRVGGIFVMLQHIEIISGTHIIMLNRIISCHFNLIILIDIWFDLIIWNVMKLHWIMQTWILLKH